MGDLHRRDVIQLGALSLGAGAVPLAGHGRDQVPDTRTMMDWIEKIVERGIRRPGYPADRWVERWAAARFRWEGLRDVRLEPLDTPIWRPRSASLTVWPTDNPGEITRFRGFALPYTKPTKGTVAPIGAGAGAMVVQDITFTQLPQAYVATLASGRYDPEGVFATDVQTVPFDFLHGGLYDDAIAAGAAGYVGLLTGVPWETRDYYVPYDAKRRPIPAIWLSGDDGRRLRALTAGRAFTALIRSEATITTEVTHNVVGTLPGESDRWVIIASHHDGPWASAVEDASGISLVLAQARYWARQRRRPHNLLFLLTSGHMAGGAGTQAFIAQHQDLLPKVALEVHLEHVARRCNGVDGKLVTTDDPEVRWWYTSRDAALEQLVTESITAEGLGRSWLLPPTAFGPMPLTDGAYFYPAGVPLVQFITAPMYLFDSADTVDKIHEPSLVPLTKAVSRIIAGA